MQVLAAKRNGARPWFQMPAYNFEQRGLTRPVRADDGHQLPSAGLKTRCGKLKLRVTEGNVLNTHAYFGRGSRVAWGQLSVVSRSSVHFVGSRCKIFLAKTIA